MNFKFRKGSQVKFADGGVDPLKILDRQIKGGLPEYKIQSKSLNVFYVREWEIVGVSTPKTAVFAGVEVISLVCPKCGEPCVTGRGSQMVIRGDEQVKCEACNETYDLPMKAIKLFMNMA